MREGLYIHIDDEIDVLARCCRALIETQIPHPRMHTCLSAPVLCRARSRTSARSWLNARLMQIVIVVAIVFAIVVVIVVVAFVFRLE